MKITVKSNVDFSKLARNIKSITDKILNESAKGSALESKRIIDSKTLKPLSKTTISVREDGNFYEGDGRSVRGQFFQPKFKKEGLKSITRDTPLKYTGDLYKSLKANKGAVMGKSYGLKHEKGYRVRGSVASWGVPASPFLSRKVPEGVEEKFVKNVQKKLRK